VSLTPVDEKGFAREKPRVDAEGITTSDASGVQRIPWPPVCR
jgi:hypothetical protein